MLTVSNQLAVGRQKRTHIATNVFNWHSTTHPGQVQCCVVEVRIEMWMKCEMCRKTIGFRLWIRTHTLFIRGRNSSLSPAGNCCVCCRHRTNRKTTKLRTMNIRACNSNWQLILACRCGFYPATKLFQSAWTVPVNENKNKFWFPGLATNGVVNNCVNRISSLVFPLITHRILERLRRMQVSNNE